MRRLRHRCHPELLEHEHDVSWYSAARRDVAIRYGVSGYFLVVGLLTLAVPEVAIYLPLLPLALSVAASRLRSRRDGDDL